MWYSHVANVYVCGTFLMLGYPQIHRRLHFRTIRYNMLTYINLSGVCRWNECMWDELCLSYFIHLVRYEYILLEYAHITISKRTEPDSTVLSLALVICVIICIFV